MLAWFWIWQPFSKSDGFLRNVGEEVGLRGDIAGMIRSRCDIIYGERLEMGCFALSSLWGGAGNWLMLCSLLSPSRVFIVEESEGDWGKEGGFPGIACLISSTKLKNNIVDQTNRYLTTSISNTI
jgi:hypothetical protein